MLGRQRHDFRRRLLGHVVDRPEEIVEAAGRRDPEEALYGLLGLVEDAVRDAHRHADEVARFSEHGAAVEHELELALEHVDELVLRRMDVRGDERSRRKGRVPGEGTLAHLLRHVDLAENVPADVVDAFAGFGDAR